MKKLFWLLVLVVAATAVREGYEHFGPMAQAYRSYREQARAELLSHPDDPRFRSVEGRIVDVHYALESAERLDDGSVRIVVVEAVRFQSGGDAPALSDRRVARTRQRIVMRRSEERWVVADLVEEETEITEVGAGGTED